MGTSVEIWTMPGFESRVLFVLVRLSRVLYIVLNSLTVENISKIRQATPLIILLA